MTAPQPGRRTVRAWWRRVPVSAVRPARPGAAATRSDEDGGAVGARHGGAGTESTPARPPRRLPGAARTVAAWCAALAYPVLLHTAVLNEGEPTGTRLALPALLAVLPVALLRRRPLVTLALVLAGTFAATVTAASVLAAGAGFADPGTPAPDTPGPGTRARPGPGSSERRATPGRSPRSRRW
ncbi:hypothetical protein ACFQ60_39830 [Streptomyces zhihengii]